MARAKTCVHDRPKDRGPIITPKGSWCFVCNEGTHSKQQAWSNGRNLSTGDVDRFINEVDPKTWNGYAWTRERYAVNGERMYPPMWKVMGPLVTYGAYTEETAYKMPNCFSPWTSERANRVAKMEERQIILRIKAELAEEKVRRFNGQSISVDVPIKNLTQADVFIDGRHVGHARFARTPAAPVKQSVSEWVKDFGAVEYSSIRDDGTYTFAAPITICFDEAQAIEVRRELYDTLIKQFDNEILYGVDYSTTMQQRKEEQKLFDNKFDTVDANRDSYQGRLRPGAQAYVSVFNAANNTAPYAVLVGKDLEDFNGVRRLRQLNSELEAAQKERERCQKSSNEMRSQAGKAQELANRISDERYQLLQKLGVKAQPVL